MLKIAYLRTSTEDQRPEDQENDVMTIAPPDVIIKMEQQSAWKDQIKARPVFSEIREQIKQGKVSDLYVWDLDRIYRNRLQTISFLKLCHANGCKIHSFRQKWLDDINKVPAPWNEIINDFLVHILAWIAEEESNKRSDRIKKSVDYGEDGVTRSTKGKPWGRPRKREKFIIPVCNLKRQNPDLSTRDIAGQLTENGTPISHKTVFDILNDHEDLWKEGIA